MSDKYVPATPLEVESCTSHLCQKSLSSALMVWKLMTDGKIREEMGLIWIDPGISTNSEEGSCIVSLCAAHIV